MPSPRSRCAPLQGEPWGNPTDGGGAGPEGQEARWREGGGPEPLCMAEGSTVLSKRGGKNLAPITGAFAIFLRGPPFFCETPGGRHQQSRLRFFKHLDIQIQTSLGVGVGVGFAPIPPLHQALMPRPDGRLPNMWEPLRRPFKLLLGKVRPLVPPLLPLRRTDVGLNNPEKSEMRGQGDPGGQSQPSLDLS